MKKKSVSFWRYERTREQGTNGSSKVERRDAFVEAKGVGHWKGVMIYHSYQ